MNTTRILQKIVNAGLLNDHRELKNEALQALGWAKPVLLENMVATINTAQERMPSDWLVQLLDAKVEVDKWNKIAVSLIIPNKWAEDFLFQIKDVNLPNYMYDRNTLWGCEISFADIDSPEAK